MSKRDKDIEELDREVVRLIEAVLKKHPSLCPICLVTQVRHYLEPIEKYGEHK